MSFLLTALGDQQTQLLHSGRITVLLWVKNLPRVNFKGTDQRIERHHFGVVFIVFDMHNRSDFNICHINYFALGKPLAFSGFLNGIAKRAENSYIVCHIKGILQYTIFE